MGLFTSVRKPSDPAPSQDGGFIAPDRTQRSLCYAGRDAFFACLDAHDIVDSVKQDADARAACPRELREFESVCASSWITYFKKRRVMEFQRDATLRKLQAEGAKGMEGLEIQRSSSTGAGK